MINYFYLITIFLRDKVKVVWVPCIRFQIWPQRTQFNDNNADLVKNNDTIDKKIEQQNGLGTFCLPVCLCVCPPTSHVDRD